MLLVQVMELVTSGGSASVGSVDSISVDSSVDSSGSSSGGGSGGSNWW